MGMTSLPVIEKRPISPKPLQIGVSFLLTTNRKSLVGFQNMGSDLKFGAPSGEIGMTSLPVIETRPISRKPLHIGISFLLNTNRKSLVCFQNMRSDLKFGAPSGEIGMTSFAVIEKRPVTPKPQMTSCQFHR